MTLDELTPGMLVATARGEILKVQKIEFKRLRAQVVFPHQKKPLFREYGEDMVALMHPPKDSLMRKYEEDRAKRKK